MTASPVLAAPSGGAGASRPQSDDEDTFSTAATAAESSPLQRSASSSTAGTGRTGSDAPGGGGGSGSRTPSPPPPAGRKQARLGRGRAAAVVAGMATLIFLQTASMSGMAVAQGAVAGDLAAAAPQRAVWFASAYLIGVGAASPLVGRLATVFAPRALVAGAAGLFALAAAAAAAAPGFAAFVAARALMGVAGGAVMALSVVLVLHLADDRRRGLFIGLTNAAFTVGISAGAVVFGALLDAVGWVGCLSSSPVLSEDVLADCHAVYRGYCFFSRRRSVSWRVWPSTSACRTGRRRRGKDRSIGRSGRSWRG